MGGDGQGFVGEADGMPSEGGRVLVHGDGARVDGVRLGQRLAEEAFGGRGVSLCRQQEVNGLAEAVDRAIQLGPDTLDLDVGLSTRQEPVHGRKCGRILRSSFAA